MAEYRKKPVVIEIKKCTREDKEMKESQVCYYIENDCTSYTN